MTSRERVAFILREVADRSKLSNGEIARRAGVSKSTITEAIRGTYSMRLETLERIVEACGFRVEIAAINRLRPHKKRLVFPPTS